MSTPSSGVADLHILVVRLALPIKKNLIYANSDVQAHYEICTDFPLALCIRQYSRSV